MRSGGLARQPAKQGEQTPKATARMQPRTATNFATRVFLEPALKTQPDRRLVSLVRDGHERAFDEIVRRYGRSLSRYAAAIVPSQHAEDVIQDALAKALLALRDADVEIDLRPWLFRIVRNTALNDLRDQPPATAPLHEGIDGVDTPAEVVERKEEIAALIGRIRDLPERQRASIVMRELEGMSHEEIAAGLGLTRRAARQAIYRARRALRDGVGMLIPTPLLRQLLACSVTERAAVGLGGAAAVGGAGVAASAGGGASAALTAGLATALVAGSVGVGVTIDSSQGSDVTPPPPTAIAKADAGTGAGATGLSFASHPGGMDTANDHGAPGAGLHAGEPEQAGAVGSNSEAGQETLSDGASHASASPGSGQSDAGTHSSSPESGQGRQNEPGGSGGAPSQSREAPGKVGDAPGQPGDAPGKSGDAPGQSGDPPGQSGHPPGQSGNPPGNSSGPPGQSGDPPGQSGDPPGNSSGPPVQSGSEPHGSGSPASGASGPGSPHGGSGSPSGGGSRTPTGHVSSGSGPGKPGSPR
jgi:RNA polymerase sigma factor (sigma-70 family)